MSDTNESPSKPLPTLGWLQDNFKNKSSAIRYLASEGHDAKVISKLLDIKYQHAYNVSERFKKAPKTTHQCPVCKGKL